MQKILKQTASEIHFDEWCITKRKTHDKTTNILRLLDLFL